MPQVKAPTTQLLRRSPNKRAKRGVENVCVQSRFMQDAAKKPAAEEPPLKKEPAGKRAGKRKAPEEPAIPEQPPTKPERKVRAKSQATASITPPTPMPPKPTPAAVQPTSARPGSARGAKNNEQELKRLREDLAEQKDDNARLTADVEDLNAKRNRAEKLHAAEQETNKTLQAALDAQKKENARLLAEHKKESAYPVWCNRARVAVADFSPIVFEAFGRCGRASSRTIVRLAAECGGSGAPLLDQPS